MIPTAYSDDLKKDFTMHTKPSRTYRLNFNGKPSTGMVSGIEAMKQAIWLILNTERYEYTMFSWNYGIELRKLMGQGNTVLLQAKLQHKISEALLQDDRILSATNFVFEQTDKQRLHVTFTVSTTEGQIPSDVDFLLETMEVEN